MASTLNSLPSNKLVILAMDESGSMGSAASNDIEALGFTRNDFARQGAILCVNACPETMHMAVIAFDNNARIVSDTKLMNRANKAKMITDITAIRPVGGTNIMSVMFEIKKIIDQSRDIYGITDVNVIMFTDGEDPRLSETNVSSELDKIKISGEFGFKMDTVGFGPDANTQLLVKMASLCSGTYALCFDASMVGTIFGRAIARTYLGADAFGIYEPDGVKSTEYYNFKDAYHRYRNGLSQLVLAQYRTLLERVQAINTFNTELEQWLTTNQPAETTNPDWYGHICGLHADLNDQIRMAVTDSTYWAKWGKAYWQTMGIALAKQYAPNFKDNCLQCFGSPLAKAEYERISEIYNEMPLISPSNTRDVARRHAPPPSTSQAFNDRSAGCFHPASTVQLASGEVVGYERLVQLMLSGHAVFIVSQTHGIVPVEAILKTKQKNTGTQFCRIGNTVLTPTHPVLVVGNASTNGSASVTPVRWFHPKTLAPVFEENVEFVFNLILGINPVTGKRYESALIDETECICLGHGIQNDPIATDSFWGSEQIVTKLKEYYGQDYANRVIDFNHVFKRNQVTGWVDNFA